jgi:hypothetical protein
MNIRSSVVAACQLVATTVGCGTVTASQPGGGAHPAASAVRATANATAGAPSRAPGVSNPGTGAGSGCQHPAARVLTLASNGKTYCARVGEKFDVYLRGTLASRWLIPLASSDLIKPVPNGALSLIAGLTGESFAGVRPGQVLITSVRLPCSGPVMQKSEALPKGPVPRTYRLVACAPQHRFIVSIIVVS